MITLKQFEEALASDSALLEKYSTEYRRLRESCGSESEAQTAVKAAKAAGFDLSLSELEKSAASMEELDPDSLDQVSGGSGLDDFFTPSPQCNIGYTISLNNRTTSADPASGMKAGNKEKQSAPGFSGGPSSKGM